MKKVTKNKTPEVKENLNIITVDDYPELAYKFIHHLYHTDKTVALIAGRDLVELPPYSRLNDRQMRL